MPQFDVHANPRGGAYPFLVDVQSELLGRLDTRVVIPLITRRKLGAPPITRLNPIARVAGHDYVVLTQELAAVPASALGERVGSLVAQRAELIAALDLLFTGI